jgi:alternate signal-mediated exported protein
MKKKILAIALVVAMLAIAIVGASLAYFTDEGHADNTFTIGNIEIDLHEKFDELNADLVPGVTITKEVTVQNTSGTGNDAYVRVQIAILRDLAPSTIFAADGFLQITDADPDNWDWPIGGDNIYEKEIEGRWYRVFTGVYKHALADGATTPAAIKTVTLNPKVDGYVENNNLVLFLEKDNIRGVSGDETTITIDEKDNVSIRTNNGASGVITPAENTTTREFFTHILVRAEATQTTGIADATGADAYLDVAFGQPKDTSVWANAYDAGYNAGVTNGTVTKP